MERNSTELPPLFKEYRDLVSKYFREKHQVADYAELLHKSPKTLVNYFSKMNLPRPVQILHGRLLLESASLLAHTDKPVRQLAAEVGFFDLDTFSRCFKNKTGLSPTNYRLSFDKKRASALQKAL